VEKIIQCLRNDKFAERANIELVEVSPGFSRVRMTLGPQHYNGLGTAHGGAIFTLADFAFAAAANSYGTVAVAINVHITFIKSAQTGVLLAEAKEVSKNFKLGTYSVEVKNEQGEMIALFQGTAYRKADKLPV
jgi:acyl-CoA thioesterase